MICPNCGTSIPDDAPICPACHFDLGRTTVMARLSGTWCPSCGALVPEGAEVCPSCGMPQERPAAKERQAAGGRPAAPEAAAERTRVTLKINQALAARIPAIDGPGAPQVLPDAADLEAEKAETHSMPRIESAIPSEPDAYEEGEQPERIPRPKVMVGVAACAVALVGGVVLFITHPWNPDAFSTKATTPADTSMAGYPGERDSLSQDQSANRDGSSSGGEVSGDEYTYQQLEGYWEELGSLSASIDDNEASFDQDATSGAADARQKGESDSEDLAIQVSNLITKIQDVDTTSGTYAQTSSDLQTLGSYLRNRIDALRKGWQRSAASDDPAQDASSITAPVDGDGATFKQLFDQSYQGAKPQAPS